MMSTLGVAPDQFVASCCQVGEATGFGNGKDWIQPRNEIPMLLV